MAIDQDIAQRVDAYRGNPQALQQRYAANQELLDLLALQRLKSEKDDAMRKVQLEMEQDPQTIKQQKERQLLEMTKQDLTNQTAGIMQNAQKKQQKNMQRVAKQGAPSPQQMQQVQSGLGALAQRQQGQAPMRMAAGGIVAFQEGGEVTQADIDAYRERLKKTNPWVRRSAMVMSDERIRNILSGQIETAEFEEKGAEASTPRPGPGEYDLQDRSASNRRNQFDTTGVPKPPRTTDETSPAETTTETGLAAMLQENQLTAPIIDVSGAGARGENILEQTGLGLESLQNPNAARTDARDDAATFLGRDEKRDTMNDHLEQLKAMDVSQQDPKKLWDQEISAFLRGTAGGGSFGQTMAGGSQGMADERSAQEKSSRDRLLSRLNIEKSAMDMDMDIAKSAQSSGDDIYAQVMANRRQASQVLASTSNQDLQVSMEQARLDYAADADNIRNRLDAAEINHTRALRQAIESSDASQRGLTLLTDLQRQKTDIFKDLAESDRRLQNATTAVQANPDDSAAIDAYDAAYKALQIRANSYFEMSSDNGLSFNEVEALALRLYQGEDISLGNLPTGPTPGLNANGFGPLTVKP